MIPHWKKGTGPRVKNAQKTTLDVGGKPHTFPSKAEALRYLDLERMQKAGIVKEIELQPKFILRPAYSKCCHDVISNPASKGICHFCGKKMPKTPAWAYRADFELLGRMERRPSRMSRGLRPKCSGKRSGSLNTNSRN